MRVCVQPLWARSSVGISWNSPTGRTSTFHFLPDCTSNQLVSLIKSYFLFSSTPWGCVTIKKSLCTLVNYRSMTVVCDTCRWSSRLTGYGSASCGNALNPKIMPGPGTRTGWDLSPRCLARLLTNSDFMADNVIQPFRKCKAPATFSQGRWDRWQCKKCLFSGSHTHLTGDEVCYSQHHRVCPTIYIQAMQTGWLFCPPRHGQDHCKCRYYNLLLPQNSGIIRRPSVQKGSIRHANVMGIFQQRNKVLPVHCVIKTLFGNLGNFWRWYLASPSTLWCLSPETSLLWGYLLLHCVPHNRPMTINRLFNIQQRRDFFAGDTVEVRTCMWIGRKGNRQDLTLL